MAYWVQYEFQERNMYPVASLNSFKEFWQTSSIPFIVLSAIPEKRSKKKRPRIVTLSAQRSKRKTDCSKSDHGIELCVINTLFPGFAKKTWIPAFPCSQFCLPWPSVANLIIGVASENEMLFSQKGNLLVRDNDKALLSSPVFAPILTQGFVDLSMWSSRHCCVCFFFARVQLQRGTSRVSSGQDSQEGENNSVEQTKQVWLVENCLLDTKPAFSQIS